MKRSLPLAAVLVVVSSAFAGSVSAPSTEPAILATNLHALEVDGKINGVLWTRRTSTFTLQVLMPLPASPRGNWPQVDAWLLRADGTRIEAAGRWDAPRCAGRPRCTGSEIQYSFPLWVGKEAVAAAVSVDAEIRTERLVPFAAPGGPR